MLGKFLQRLTDKARESLLMAMAEADALGHDAIGTEHLLLGLIQEGDGVAFDAIESTVGSKELRERVLAILDVEPIAVEDRVLIRGNPHVHTVLAIYEARSWLICNECEPEVHEIKPLSDLTKVD